MRWANDNFLGALGRKLHEIQGQHHRMFVDPDEQGAAYEQFCEALRRGEFQGAAYKRLGKDGREIWIQASYMPLGDAKLSLRRGGLLHSVGSTPTS